MRTTPSAIARVRRRHDRGGAPVLVSTLGLHASLFAMGPDACSTKTRTPPDDPPPQVGLSQAATVPPVAYSGAAPLSAFADASTIDGRTPYEQARAYEANGQYWLARLVLDKKALGSDGTKQERELLASICHEQEDDGCVEECGKRLGKKLMFDAGAPRRSAAREAAEHKEPETEAARARDHLLKHHLKEAREILEPKVLDGRASKDEIRLLRSVCHQQSDRMCMALCDAKLK